MSSSTSSSRHSRVVILRRRVVAAAVIGAVLVLAWAVLKASGIVGSVDKRGAQVERIKVKSKAVARQLPVTVVLPKGASEGDPRPLLVFLHGRGADEDTFLDDAMFKAIARLGSRAPIIAFPYGGDHSYWHDRDSGAWGRYVTNEVMPAVARRFHTRTDRVAIGGISMGGFGAYDLARLHPRRFCAVGGHSPALWTSAALTAPGAFDDARDFARHDVIAAARKNSTAFGSQPVWLDAGKEDPFRSGQRVFRSALRSAGAPLTARSWPGGHDQNYWDSHWNAYLRFYADALRRCRR
jgi:S-formylglutathione hydrolase FrmB